MEKAASPAITKTETPKQPENEGAKGTKTDEPIASVGKDDEKTETSTPTPPPTPDPEPTPEPGPTPAPAPGPATSSANLCFSDDDKLSLQLTLFAEKMEKDAIMYNSIKLSDCSGIFHRTAQFVGSKCDRYQYVARDSRSLAKWYHDNNNLVIINDAKSKRNLIKPGSVMFFGKTGKKYQPTVEQVTAPYPNGIIQHIGVVTEVTKDDTGDVTGYVMFHGRRPGVTAKRSHYHKIKPPKLGFPVLGNWEQQWVGVANIMTPK